MKKLKALAVMGLAGVLTASMAASAFAAEGFDASYYYSKYGDVAAAIGQNAALLEMHYDAFGAAEGRFKSAADEAARGKKAPATTGTAGTNDCDPVYYLGRYADLQMAFGNNTQLALQHWIMFGRAEGRIGKAPVEVNPYARFAGSSGGSSSKKSSGSSSKKKSSWTDAYVWMINTETGKLELYLVQVKKNDPSVIKEGSEELVVDPDIIAEYEDDKPAIEAASAVILVDPANETLQKKLDDAKATFISNDGVDVEKVKTLVGEVESDLTVYVTLAEFEDAVEIPIKAGEKPDPGPDPVGGEIAMKPYSEEAMVMFTTNNLDFEISYGDTEYTKNNTTVTWSLTGPDDKLSFDTSAVATKAAQKVTVQPVSGQSPKGDYTLWMVVKDKNNEVIKRVSQKITVTDESAQITGVSAKLEKSSINLGTADQYVPLEAVLDPVTGVDETSVTYKWTITNSAADVTAALVATGTDTGDDTSKKIRVKIPSTSKTGSCVIKVVATQGGVIKKTSQEVTLTIGEKQTKNKIDTSGLTYTLDNKSNLTGQITGMAVKVYENDAETSSTPAPGTWSYKFSPAAPAEGIALASDGTVTVTKGTESVKFDVTITATAEPSGEVVTGTATIKIGDTFESALHPNKTSGSEITFDPGTTAQAVVGTGLKLSYINTTGSDLGLVDAINTSGKPSVTLEDVSDGCAIASNSAISIDSGEIKIKVKSAAAYEKGTAELVVEYNGHRYTYDLTISAKTLTGP